MTSQVHEFDGREGGLLRISLTYDAPDRAGKTTSHTDTYTGRFAELVPDERVVEVDEFETDDPALCGEMTITITLSDAADGGTALVAVHDGLPSGVRPEDNELGWREALDRLAVPVEGRPRGPGGGQRPGTTCTAASSAEAAPPSIPSSKAARVGSGSGAESVPASVSASRPARPSPTSSSRS